MVRPVNRTPAIGSFNKIKFAPITTDALRLEVKLQPNHAAGVLEWRVNP